MEEMNIHCQTLAEHCVKVSSLLATNSFLSEDNLKYDRIFSQDYIIVLDIKY